MKQVKATVISNQIVLPAEKKQGRKLSKETRILWLNCPEIASNATPGQFVMVNCGGGCILPRPFSIFQTSQGNLALLYTVWDGGKGTEWLASKGIGEEINLIGPLGNGFKIEKQAINILLIAGGMGIAPIYFLALEAISQLKNVTFLYGTAGKERYPIPSEMRLISATEDGSVGYKGYITDLIPQYIDNCDQVFACGPLSMYKTMQTKHAELKLDDKRIQVSLEVRMGCGIGSCYSCTILTKQGPKQVCKDGPVFHFDEILWDSVLI